MNDKWSFLLSVTHIHFLNTGEDWSLCVGVWRNQDERVPNALSFIVNDMTFLIKTYIRKHQIMDVFFMFMGVLLN